MDDLPAVRVPLLGRKTTDVLARGGRFHARDVFEIGGVPVILKELLRGGLIDGRCPTVTGESLADAIASAPAPDGKVVRRLEDALLPSGGLAVLTGTLCPDGALIKVAGLQSRVFAGQDYENSVVLPQAEALLSRFDKRSRHYRTSIASPNE